MIPYISNKGKNSNYEQIRKTLLTSNIYFNSVATSFQPKGVIVGGTKKQYELELPPHHLIHHPGITLNDPHHLRTHILIDIIRYGNPGMTIIDQRDSNIDTLEQTLGVDSTQDEAAFVQGFGALGGGADADGREGMADGGEEGRLFGECTRVGHHCKGIHLETVVVMETQGVVADDARVKLEAGGFKALAGARVAAVEDGHVILLGHLIDGVEEGQEVLFRVDVLLPMGAQKDVLALL